VRKDLIVDSYGAYGEVVKVDDGYDAVITIPFMEEDTAERCLNSLHKLEVTNVSINLE